jgi:hypothetical protein
MPYINFRNLQTSSLKVDVYKQYGKRHTRRGQGNKFFPSQEVKKDLITQYKESKHISVHHGSNERRNNNFATGNGPNAPNP